MTSPALDEDLRRVIDTVAAQVPGDHSLDATIRHDPALVRPRVAA